MLHSFNWMLLERHGQIPDPVPRGVFKPITLSSGSPSLVVFDLETTDLIRGRQMPHITQLAAVELDTGSLYNTYILPKVPISEEAMNTTCIVVNFDLEKMTVHGFIDSLSVFKKAFPGQQNYKQETLVKAVLNTSYAAHDATEDVKTLGLLMKQTKLSGPEILQFSFPPIFVHQGLLFGNEK
uniref:Uncharacterized protein n=1 Tax=Magallana gigas TaxID=29159 RepID=K1QU82_MAGGI